MGDPPTRLTRRTRYILERQVYGLIMYILSRERYTDPEVGPTHEWRIGNFVHVYHLQIQTYRNADHEWGWTLFRAPIVLSRKKTWCNRVPISLILSPTKP